LFIIPTGKAYIGKKVLFHQKKVKLTKKELLEYTHVAGRKPAYKLAMNESDWKTYYGSNKEIIAMLKEGKHDEFTREILCLATSKKLLTYYEQNIVCIFSTRKTRRSSLTTTFLVSSSEKTLQSKILFVSYYLW
jgi:hypothetical protein